MKGKFCKSPSQIGYQELGFSFLLYGHNLEQTLLTINSYTRSLFRSPTDSKAVRSSSTKSVPQIGLFMKRKQNVLQF